MKKIIAFISALIAISCTFTSCSSSDKDTIISEDGVQYIVVRDSDGNIVINDNNKLQVYTVNENGKKQKNDNNEYITEYIDFNGQVIIDQNVETQELKFELPDGFSGSFDNPGYFFKESVNADIFITYYNSGIEKDITAIEKNCESLLESYGSDRFEYKKYTVEADNTEINVIRQKGFSSEYYKNTYYYFIPYDNGYYLVNCNISTDNENKINFDKFIKTFELK